MAEIDVDKRALEAARLAVENTLIEFRDSAMFMVGANGFVVRDEDGSPSSIMRFSTQYGLQIGIEAYLYALTQPSSDRDHAGLGLGCDPCAGPCQIDGQVETGNGSNPGGPS